MHNFPQYVCKKPYIMENYPSHNSGKNTGSNVLKIIENPIGDLTELMNVGSDTKLTFLLITNGVFECTVNQSHFYVSPRSLAVLPEMSFIGRIETSDDFKGFLISMDKAFLEALQMSMKTVVSWRRRNEPTIHRLTKKDVTVYKLYINIIQDSMNEEQTPINNEITWLLAKAFSCKIFGGYSQMGKEEEESHTRKDSLAKQFIALVQEHAIEHKDLSYYADKLCVTPKYLSGVVSKTTGKKATKWIDDCAMVHAMRLLKSTDDNIGQISDSLGYQTPSDFCRCFKRITGMTPKQYRRTV